MINEYYANLKGYEGIYIVSNYGTIKSVEREVKNKNGFRKVKSKIIKPRLDKYGYEIIGLQKNGVQSNHRVHRLVAKTFIPNPNEYPVVNHKDGNKRNNYIDNLEWCTCQENISHAYKTGLKIGKSAKHDGKYNPKVKLGEEDVLEIIKERKNNGNRKECYQKYKNKISFSGFEQIWYGHSWKTLVEKVEE